MQAIVYVNIEEGLGMPIQELSRVLKSVAEGVKTQSEEGTTMIRDARGLVIGRVSLRKSWEKDLLGVGQ